MPDEAGRGRLPVHRRAQGRRLGLARMVGHAWDWEQLTRDYDEFLEAFQRRGQLDPLVRVTTWCMLAQVPVDRPGACPKFLRAVARHRRRGGFGRLHPMGRGRDSRVEENCKPDRPGTEGLPDPIRHG